MYVFRYVRTVPDDFEPYKRLNLIFPSLLSGVTTVLV